MFQSYEAIASTKALKQDCAWHAQESTDWPVWLEWSEHKGKTQKMRLETQSGKARSGMRLLRYQVQEPNTDSLNYTPFEVQVQSPYHTYNLLLDLATPPNVSPTALLHSLYSSNPGLLRHLHTHQAHSYPHLLFLLLVESCRLHSVTSLRYQFKCYLQRSLLLCHLN